MRTALWLGIWAAVGCSGEATDDTTTPPDLDPALRLGTGTDDFVEVGDGDDIVIIFGPQGGYHLDGSLQVQGIEPGNADDLSSPDNPLTTFSVTRPGGEVISGLKGDEVVDYRQGIDTSGEPGVFEMIGRRIFLDIVSDTAIAGETLTVTVSVEDVNGVALEDSHELVAVPHPLN
ncbi:MAG: hypothetical protein KTR31_15000 [Myxococcales bacterium]|nr:hypothetical protein [Myxococcales bacterium]